MEFYEQMGTVNFSLMVILVGMVIVFAALIALTFVFSLYGKIFTAIVDKKSGKPKPPKAPKPKKTVVKQDNKATPPVQNIAMDVEDDVVAAISAAFACIMGGSTGYSISSIKRATPSRRSWSMAGIMQNMRPF